jgi:hypothetical protein
MKITPVAFPAVAGMNVSAAGVSPTETASVLASVRSSTPRVRMEFAIQAVEATAHKKKARRIHVCIVDGVRLVMAVCPVMAVAAQAQL